jgi:hypothetical protein
VCLPIHDRVTVIFSTIFREETDRVFGKVFIQEFVDARRRAIQNAPQVLFRNDPPLELQGVPGVKNTGTGEIGYVTFGMYLHRRCVSSHLTSDKFSSPATSRPSGCPMSSRTSKPSAITSTTTSRLPRRTSTPV